MSIPANRARRWPKWLAGLLALAIVVATGGWLLRRTLLLHVPAMIQRVVNPVGPNRAVAWEPGPAAPSAPIDRRPPNVVVILADDMGFNDVSFYGGGVAGGTVPTPHIDSLARDGVQFANGYAGNAVCAPSRAMIMTGRYSTRFGFEYTPAPKLMAILAETFYEGSERLRTPRVDHEAAERVPSFDELGMPPEEITLAELLKTRGYRTLHIGKWHLGRAAHFRPRAQGFDQSLMMESGKYLPEDHPDVVNSKQDFDPIDAFLWPNLRYAVSFDDSEWFEPDGYLTDYFTEQAVAAIEANRHRPFFLYLAHWAPHTPLQALRADHEALAHIEDPVLRVYAAMIRSVDRSVGRVLAALEEHGLAENTLVFFTSDNGGAHYIGLPEVNQPYRGWKLTLFEGGTHVPFFARWPRRIPRGTSYAAPVLHADLFATAAAAAGARLPDDRAIDGVDLVPYVAGEARSEPHDALLWRQGYYQVVLADGWKLQVSENPRKQWLFDLSTDPTEQRNVAAAHPQKVRELQALLGPDDEYIYWPN